MKTTVITITIVIVLLIFSLQMRLPIPKTNQATEADTPSPPTQAQICGAMGRQVDDDNRRSERMLKACKQGDWKNNEVMALECMLYLGQMKNYDQPIIFKIKKCEKIACQTTNKENQFLCEYFLDLSASNQLKPYEDHLNKTNKDIKKGLFTLIPQSWDYSPYSVRKKTSK
jgi:hypothetical protein